MKEARSDGTTKVTARPLSMYALVAIALGVLGLLVGAVLLQFLALGPNHGRMIDLQRDAHAQAYVEVVNSRVQLLQQQASRIAALPTVQAATAARSGSALLALQDSIAAAVGNLRGVRLYPSGNASADLQGNPPVTFSALDMVRAAERGEQPMPQAFRIDGRLFVYSVTPIKGAAGQVIGTVLLITDPSYIDGAFRAIAQDVGKVRLEQKFDDSEAVPLLEVGNSGSGQPLARPTSVPHWTITFDPSAQLVGEAGVSFASLAPALVAALLGIVGGALLTFTRLRGNLQSDLGELRAMFTQRRQNAAGYRLADVAECASSVTASDLRRVDVAPAPIPDARDESSSNAPRARRETRVAAPPEVDIPLELDDALIVAPAKPPAPPAKPAPSKPAIDPNIFRAYDIRGVVDRNLGEDVVYLIGRALGSEAGQANIKRLAVGSDGRLSSPSLREALMRGLREAGTDVIDIGEAPTPLLYFATHALRTGSGVMITGSHNPPDYNGLKIVLGGETFAGERIERLRERIERGDLANGRGNLERADVTRTYIERIVEDVTVAQSLKVVIDCGNGVAGKVAPELIRALGCEVVELFCDVDGTFPNHHPDPAVPANLEPLINAVRRERADIGLAFDGDGDRLGVVTAGGRIIWPDRLLMVFARDVVGRNPGCDVVYDVKCSRHLPAIVTELGGRPIMCKTGHSNIKAKIKETGALVGGEFSGHICFLERWYGFDDALYSAARLLEILGASADSVDELFAAFPDPFGTPEIKVATTDEQKFAIVDALAKNGNFEDGTINTIDGIRVDFADGWGLVRASNTSPVLTLRFEADTHAGLARVSNLFQRELLRVDPTLTFDLETA